VRTLTRLVSAVVALLLLAGGLLAALEIAAAGLGRDDDLALPWRDWRREALETPWEDPAVRVTLVAVLAVGLLLLFLLLVPRAPRGLPLVPRVEGASADLDRAGLERWLGARLGRVDGVAGPSVRVRRGGVRVRVSTPGRETGSVELGVRAAAETALADLGLVSVPPVRVSVIPRRD
jgi:Family of unknown function (DUF6286)